MKYIKTYQEFLNEKINFNIYYHGTSKTSNGEQILKDGFLKPGNINKKVGASLTPLMNGIYLTPDIQYVVPYVLGGKYAGSKFWKDWTATMGDPYGFLFIVKNIDISKCVPDEDFLGNALNYIINNKQMEYNSHYSDYDEDVINNFNKLSFDFKRNLIAVSKQILTPLQFQKISNSQCHYDTLALTGKKLIKSGISKDILKKIIDLGSSVVSFDKIEIDKAYKFDKQKTEFLKNDGSNLIELSEKIL